MEYAVHGNSDYRISALRAGKKGAVPALDLRYVSHEIKPGKYSLPGLPALFAAPGEEDVTTLEITLKDAYEEIYVKLLYGVFEGKNMITRSAVIENHMETPMELHRAMSMSLDYLDENLDLVHFYGKHVLERQFERRPLTHGITEIASVRGQFQPSAQSFCNSLRKKDYRRSGRLLGLLPFVQRKLPHPRGVRSV